jgi:uncharacterized membrane protein
MSKKDNPGTILQIVLTVLEAIGTFKWLLPTEEGRRFRELRRARRKWLKGKITDEQYEQIKKDLADPSGTDAIGQ